MKKSSSSSTSKKQTKPTVKKNDLKNISGGRRIFIPENLPDPEEMRRILDERFKR